MLQQRQMLAAVVIGLTATATAVAGAPTCLSIEDLHYVSPAQQAMHGFDTSSAYFCGPKAPAQFACSCSSSSVCVPHVSAYGTDVGRCGCCPFWLWALAAVFAVALFIMMCLAIYTCACKGRWWCDGYHPAVIPLLPARAAPVVVPGQLPLTANVFRGYRRSDFDTGLTPEAAAAAAAAAQAAAAATAAMQQQVANMQQQQQHMLQQLQQQQQQQHHQQDEEEELALDAVPEALRLSADRTTRVRSDGGGAVGAGAPTATVPGGASTAAASPRAFRGAAGAAAPARSPPAVGGGLS